MYKSCKLIANTYPLHLLARLTFNMAAPMKATITSLICHFFNELIAATATKRRTWIASCARAIASTSMCSWYVGRCVFFAEIWRSLKVQQWIFHFIPLVLLLLGLFALEFRTIIYRLGAAHFSSSIIHDYHSTTAEIRLIDQHCTTKLLLENFADRSKVRRGLPTGF